MKRRGPVEKAQTSSGKTKEVDKKVTGKITLSTKRSKRSKKRSKKKSKKEDLDSKKEEVIRNENFPKKRSKKKPTDEDFGNAGVVKLWKKW